MTVPWDKSLFVMMRHGPTAANKDKIFRAWSNARKAQLDDYGRQVVAETAAYLVKNDAPIEIIICDSLDRTMESAEIVADALQVSQVHPIRGLHPLDMGDWTLKPKDDHPVDELYTQTHRRPPNGETVDEFNVRQFDIFKVIFRLADQLPGGRILVLGHGSNVAFLYNRVFNKNERRVGYEGLVDPGGLILVNPDGLFPLTQRREEKNGK